MPVNVKEAAPKMTQDTKGVTFCVESMMTQGGRKKYKPDADGYYCDVPVAALGTTTRLQSFYDTQTMIKNIEDEKSSHFALKLKSGSLYGEWGHPSLEGLPKDQYMPRILKIDEDRACHQFRSVRKGPELEGGGCLVVADLKPVFDKGRNLKESLDDPNLNTAFSLRSLTRNEQRGPVSYRRMLKLVTFDAVLTPGFAQASKSYAPISTESIDGGDFQSNFVLSVPTDNSGKIIIDEYSTESFTDTELNEILGTNNIKKTFHYKTVLEHNEDPSRHVRERAQSYFNAFMKG